MWKSRRQKHRGLLWRNEIIYFFRICRHLPRIVFLQNLCGIESPRDGDDWNVDGAAGFDVAEFVADVDDFGFEVATGAADCPLFAKERYFGLDVCEQIRQAVFLQKDADGLRRVGSYYP